MILVAIKLLIYGAASTAVFLMIRELLYIRRRSPPKVAKQFSMLMDQTKPWYQDQKLDQAIADAGLRFMSAWTYKLCRDVMTFILVIGLQVRFLMTGTYPLGAMIGVAVLYLFSLTGRSWMPFSIVLSMLKSDRLRKKNDEIVLVYMLLTNDSYTESHDHFQSLLSKLKEYRKDLHVLRADLDQLIFDFQIDGSSAFKAFGKRIGTKEAETLASLMEKMNQSNPQTTVDLLEQHYETFLNYRRQRRKRQLRANGHLGFAIVMLAIIVVLMLLQSVTGAYQDLLFNEFQW